MGSVKYIYMRPCLNELQKEYCVKTKVIELDWQWVTLRSWCQMNRNGHSSPVKHKVEGKPHNFFEKLKITSGKSPIFGHFLWSFFWSPVFTSVFLWIEIIFPLFFTYIWLWIFGGFALVLGRAREKGNNKTVKWVSREVKLFLKFDF